MKPRTLLLVIALLGAGVLAFHLLANPVPAGSPSVRLVIRPTSEGGAAVVFEGEAGVRYRLESTDNLRDWEVLAEGLGGTAGRIEWCDTRPPAARQRFYRAVPVSLAAQKSAGPPLRAPSDQLVEAVLAGDHASVLVLLRGAGLPNESLARLTNNLAAPVRRVKLPDDFLRATTEIQRGSTNARAVRYRQAQSRDYHLFCWRAEPFQTNWPMRADKRLAQVPHQPIGFLQAVPSDPYLIEKFVWFDRYADRLHSVVLNGKDGDNSAFAAAEYPAANRTLAALYRLIKARRPGTFVWLRVEHRDNQTDVHWLRSLPFRPDGLLVGNLQQFHSPFASVRDQYRRLLGEDLPLMLAGFYGYRDAVREAAQTFDAINRDVGSAERALAKALAKEDSDDDIPALRAALTDRQTALVSAERELARVGRVIAPLLSRQEDHLRSLGYRGLVLHWEVVQALAAAENFKE